MITGLRVSVVLWTLALVVSNCRLCAEAHSTVVKSATKDDFSNQIVQPKNDGPDRKQSTPLFHEDRKRSKREIPQSGVIRANRLHQRPDYTHRMSLYQRQAAERQLRERNDHLRKKSDGSERFRSSRTYDPEARDRLQRRRERLRQLRRQRQRSLQPRRQQSRQTASLQNNNTRGGSTSVLNEAERKADAIREMQRERLENRRRQSRLVQGAKQSDSGVTKPSSFFRTTHSTPAMVNKKTVSSNRELSKLRDQEHYFSELTQNGRQNKDEYAPAYTTYDQIRVVSLEHPSSNSLPVPATADDKFSVIASTVKDKIKPENGEESEITSMSSPYGPTVVLDEENSKFHTFNVYSIKEAETTILVSPHTTLNPFLKATEALDYLGGYERRLYRKVRPLIAMKKGDVIKATLSSAVKSVTKSGAPKPLVSEETSDFKLSAFDNPSPPRIVSPRQSDIAETYSESETDGSVYSKIGFHSQQVSSNDENVQSSYPSETTKISMLELNTTASKKTKAASLPSLTSSPPSVTQKEPRETEHSEALEEMPPESEHDAEIETVRKESNEIKSTKSRRERLRRLLLLRRLKKEKKDAIKTETNLEKNPSTLSQTNDSHVALNNTKRQSSSLGSSQKTSRSETSGSIHSLNSQPPSSTIDRSDSLVSQPLISGGNRDLISAPQPEIINIKSQPAVAMVRDNKDNSAAILQSSTSSTPFLIDSSVSVDNKYEDVVGSGEPGNDGNAADEDNNSDNNLNSKPYLINQQVITASAGSLKTNSNKSNEEGKLSQTVSQKADQDYENVGRRWSVTQEAWDNRNLNETSGSQNEVKDSTNSQSSRVQRRKQRRKGWKRRKGRKKNKKKDTQTADGSVTQDKKSSTQSRKPGRNSAARRWRERMRKRARKNKRKNRKDKSNRRGSMANALNSFSPTPKVSEVSTSTELPESLGSPFIGYKTAYDFLSNQKRPRGIGRNSESERESQELNRYMGEGMCEIFKKHYVSTRIGGKCV